MRNTLIILLTAIVLHSCGSKKAADNPENFPKDIALKPENNVSQQLDKELMTAKIKEIDSLIATVSCSDPEDWTFAAIGSKPCGGPSSYIAYPKKDEDQILLKIQQFTALQSAFNKKYRLMSDCMMVQPPAGIKCEEGKAVLISGHSLNTAAQ